MRTVRRFLFGIASFFALLFLAVVVLFLLLIAASAALCLVWSVINGVLFLASGNPQLGHQALTFLLISAMIFGVLVVIYGFIWDAFCAVRRRLGRRPA